MTLHRSLTLTLALSLAALAAHAAPPLTARAAAQQTRTVSAQEYRKAVTDFTKAFAAAEEARKRLAILQPDNSKPDSLDCLFHPWHAGCQDLWTAAEQNRVEELRAAVTQHLDPQFGTPGALQERNPWVAAGIGWAVGKALDYLWDVGACLYKGDVNGQGFEGPDGMKKFGDCFVSPGALAEPRAWTPWLNRDNPGGSGDYETLKDFLAAGKACASPLEIECRTVGGIDWKQAGQVYHCDTRAGGRCVNSQQPPGVSCKNYEVRFYCPL